MANQPTLAVMTPRANSGNNKGTIVFGYDHMGRRVYKIAYAANLLSNTTSLYFFDLGGRLLEQMEQPSNNTLAFREQYWIWAGGAMVGGGFYNQEGFGISSQQIYNYHLDHQGRPVALTSLEGIPMWRSQARPYGRDPGYDLKDKPYVEVDITNNPIQKAPYGPNEYHNQVKSIIKSGTYGIQFRFDTLKLETGRDTLFLYSQNNGNDDFLHAMTGDHQSGAWGNSGGAFWGPVIHVRATDLNSSGLGNLLFRLHSDLGQQWQGYKISKYRLWHIPEGESSTIFPYDSPAVGGQAYADNLGNGTPPWERSYTKTGAKLSRVCFGVLSVEHGYDRVEIRDKDHNITQVLTGTHFGCSQWVQGDTVKVQLYSDNTQQGNGFEIQMVEHLGSPRVKARFPGQWYDKDTEVTDAGGNVVYAGLSYNWHRYYDAEVGRYITPDPIGLMGGMNRYAYVEGNPKNATDFMGLQGGVVLPFHSTMNNPTGWTVARMLFVTTAAGAGTTTTIVGPLNPTPDTPVAPTPAPQPEPDCPDEPLKDESFDLAIGLNKKDRLRIWAGKHGYKTYWDFHQDSFPGYGELAVRMVRLFNKAERIRINLGQLEGTLREIYENGELGIGFKNITNWEIHFLIRLYPQKLLFYRNSSQLQSEPTPFEELWRE